jgi:glycosyltransferase involved in cell wall biosynthesis
MKHEVNLGTTNASKDLSGLRVAIVQPVLPKYRVPFFDLLARSTGIELTVLCDMHPSGSLKSTPPTNAFRAEHYPVRELGPFSSHAAAWDSVTKRCFDVAVIGWNLRILQLVPSLLRARASGRPVLLWGHGFSRKERAATQIARNSLVGLANGVVLYSNTVRNRLITSGVPASKIWVAQNAIDQSAVRVAAEAWGDNPSLMREWQREHGIQQGELVVFISRVERDKRVDLLVDAFSRLVRRRPRARLAIIGGGSMIDSVRADVEARGLSDRVTFTGPIYDEDQLAPWCLSAGCFAYPEAIGLSIYHGLGYGLPIVTSDDIASHGPEIESLEPGVNGLLYCHRDMDDFADAMDRVLSDPAGRAEWRRRSLDTVSRPGGFNLESMVLGYADALRACASSFRRG